MSRILFYINRRFFRILFLISVLIVLLILIFDFIGQSNAFARFNPSTSDVVLYVLFNTPDAFAQLMPLIILLTSMFTFLSLAQRSELVVMRAMGIPTTRFVLIVVLCAMIIGALFATLANPVIVNSRIYTMEKDDTIRDRTRGISQVAGNGIWLRENRGNETRIIRFDSVDLANEAANGVEFFIDDNIGKRRVITAKTATIDNNGDWVLENVDEIVFTVPVSNNHYDRLVLSADQRFSTLFRPLTEPLQVNNFEMIAHLRALERDGYNTRAARSYFYRSLASPLTYGTMALVGAIFALAPFRSANIVIRLLAALGTGFALFAFDSFTASLGRANYLPLWFSSIAISILGLALGYLLLIYQEDG